MSSQFQFEEWLANEAFEGYVTHKSGGRAHGAEPVAAT
jgi:hypothetical protein